MKFSEKLGNGPVNKRLNFGGALDHRLDTRIVFRIRHYWEIRKVVSELKYAANTHSPDGSTGRTFLGGGMHCPVLLVFPLFSPHGRLFEEEGT